METDKTVSGKGSKKVREITKFSRFDEETGEAIILSQSGEELFRIKMKLVKRGGGCIECPLDNDICEDLFIDCAGTTFGTVCSNIGFRHHPIITPDEFKRMLRGKVVKKKNRGI